MAIDRGPESGLALADGVLLVYGDVDPSLADRLLEVVLSELAAGVPDHGLRIDLNDVLFLSARGVHALEGALEAAGEAGVRLVVVADPGCAAHLVLGRIGMGRALG